MTWAEFEMDRNAAINGIVTASGFDSDNQRKLRDILDLCGTSYGNKRQQDTLWKICEGKQVLNAVAQDTGFSGAPTLAMASFVVWSGGENALPDELAALRAHLAAI
jgi:hypothetical protein